MLSLLDCGFQQKTSYDQNPLKPYCSIKSYTEEKPTKHPYPVLSISDFTLSPFSLFSNLKSMEIEACSATLKRDLPMKTKLTGAHNKSKVCSKQLAEVEHDVPIADI